MLLISGKICPLVCVVGLELVWVVGYRGGGGRTNMVQLKLTLKAKTKRRDPASAGMRWRLRDDALLRIRNTSLHSKMALRKRSAFVNTQHI